jgi:hypothetical protein
LFEETRRKVIVRVVEDVRTAYQALKILVRESGARGRLLDVGARVLARRII